MKIPPDFTAERNSYLAGFGFALTLTLISFGAVSLSSLSRSTAIAIIAVSALLQILVHFRYFLHIDASRQKREDLQLILFTTLLIVMMVGGTIWIMSNLAMRM